MWHYIKDNQSAGPVDVSEVEALIRNNQITRSTKVWREGMSDWKPAIETELQSAFQQDTPPPVAPPALTPSPLSYQPQNQLPTAEDVKRLNNWFLTYWICMAAGMPLTILIIGIGGVIAGVVFYCLIMHKLWSLIPVRVAKTTPGKAVGFLGSSAEFVLILV